MAQNTCWGWRQLTLLLLMLPLLLSIPQANPNLPPLLLPFSSSNPIFSFCILKHLEFTFFYIDSIFCTIIFFLNTAQEIDINLVFASVPCKACLLCPSHFDYNPISWFSFMLLPFISVNSQLLTWLLIFMFQINTFKFQMNSGSLSIFRFPALLILEIFFISYMHYLFSKFFV